jgi:hypothetical protein
MVLGESHKVSWYDIFNAPFVNHARRYQPELDQNPQPSRLERVEFVVVNPSFQAV